MAKPHSHRRTEDGMIWWVPADPARPPEFKATSFKFPELGTFVDGYIEIVRSPHLPKLECGCGLVMVVNEEGLLMRLPQNSFGSLLYAGPTPICGDIFLAAEGPVVYSENPDDDPEPDLFGLPSSLGTWLALTSKLGRG